MTNRSPLSDFAGQLRTFMARQAGGAQNSAALDDREFNRLALELFALQFTHNGPYQKFCRARKSTPASLARWEEIPAMPTSAFKELELTGLSPAERTAVFHSSGTTEQRPSRHFHGVESLALYEASLRAWFKIHLVRETDVSVLFVMLTPPPALAPHSSLAHMLAAVSREFGAEKSGFTGKLDADGAWVLDGRKVMAVLERAMNAAQPVVLLGTAFSFVHLIDSLGARCFTLPAGSRVMETGGYKGRSRALPKAELHALIARHLGVPNSHIVCEYGMSELGSQAYDLVVTQPDSRRVFHFPAWSRARIISPETGREVADGGTGLLRVFDLANVWSVLAVQTEDLAVRRGAGFELIGRAVPAEPRGCSLMAN